MAESIELDKSLNCFTNVLPYWKLFITFEVINETMNANLKITRHKSKEGKDGKAPLTIRITKSRKIAYIFLKYSILENEWDEGASRVKKNHPNSRRLNVLIADEFANAEKVMLDAENKEQDFTAAQLKDLILGGGYSFISFNKLCREYLDDLVKAKKFNQAIPQSARFNTFIRFLKRENLGVPVENKVIETQKRRNQKTFDYRKHEVDRDINLHDIKGPLLKKYEVYLSGTTKSKITKYNQLNVIRTIYNLAQAKELIDSKNYPFGRGNKQILLERGESMKIGLERNELLLLQNIDISENNLEIVEALSSGVKYIKSMDSRINDLIHARNIYFYSFYFAGIRFSDTLKTKWKDFKSNRFYYVMGKNSKPTSVPIPVQVNSILDYYRSQKENDDDYIFPELKKARQDDPYDIYRKLRTANKKINTDLGILSKVAKIEKPVRMHIARHTFGNLSKGTLAPEVLQALYRHSHLSTTINYQRNWIRQEQLDDGLMSVVNAV
jgi:integrase